MTLSIMPFNIMALSIMTFSIMAVIIMTFSTMAVSIRAYFSTLSINDTQHNNNLSLC